MQVGGWVGAQQTLKLVGKTAFPEPSKRQGGAPLNGKGVQLLNWDPVSSSVLPARQRVIITPVGQLGLWRHAEVTPPAGRAEACSRPLRFPSYVACALNRAPC